MRKLLLLLVLMLTACSKADAPVPAHAIDVSWRYQNTVNFHLTDAGGKPRQLSDFRDKVVVLFFGFTHCPEVCPTTMADLSRVMDKLGPDARRVQVLFVTLDPERDTPDVLSKYVPAFNPAFMGLYGDAKATAQAAGMFGVSYQKHFDDKGGYTLDHSDWTYLIGGKGRIVWQSPYQQRTDYVVEDIKSLLQTTG